MWKKLKPTWSMHTVLLVAVCSYVVPGAVALRQGVFVEAEVRGRVACSDTERGDPAPAAKRERVARDALWNALCLKAPLCTVEKGASAKLTPSAPCDDEGDHSPATKADRASTKDPAASKDRAHFVPFFPGIASTAWPIAFLSLGLLLHWRRTLHGGEAPSSATTAWLTLLFAVAYIATNAVRELAPTYASGRRIYSFTSFDISPYSVLVMYGQFIVLSVYVATIWEYWLRVPRDRFVPSEEWRDHAECVLDADNVEDVAQAANNWLKAAALVTGGFAPATLVYWQLVRSYRDYRYLLPGVTMHVIWLGTLCVISVPALKKLWTRHRHRTSALGQLARDRIRGDANHPTIAELKESFDAVQPVAPINVLLAFLASLASLLAPLTSLFD